MAERTYRPTDNAKAELLTPKKRFWELDFLRGLCVLLMMLDHFFFSADWILSSAVWSWSGEFWTGLNQLAQIYWVNEARAIARFVVIALFFMICGISCTLSHNNLARGVKTLIAGLIITMATWLADKILGAGVLIVFGVIHMLGCAMLLFSLFDFIGYMVQTLVESPKRAGSKTVGLWIRRMLPAIAGLVGLVVFFTVPLAHFGKESSFIYVDGKNVEFFYTSLIPDFAPSGSNFSRIVSYFFVESARPHFASSDYFPIIPWTFLVLIGSGIGQLVYKTRAKWFLSPLGGVWHKPLGFVGRHALLFYLLHQLAIVAFFFAAGGIHLLFS